MTGRELIVYILQNNLEDEVLIKDDGVFDIRSFGFMTANEAASKFEVAAATIQVWYSTGVLKGVSDAKGNVYIFKDARDPRCA